MAAAPSNPPASSRPARPASPPERANPPAAARFGPIERFAEIDSTNRYLLDAAVAGRRSAGAVAVADRQTAGRGRLGRTWTAPPGGSLLVSVLLGAPANPNERHLLTLSAGIAAAEAVTTLTDGHVAPRLKWPNDLVVDDRKLAGVLAESVGGHVVVGMGLNIDWPGVPDELIGIATALNLAGAVPPPTRDSVLDLWLDRWHGWLAVAEAPAGPERVVAAATRLSATIGSSVRVELASERFEGLAERITDAGHLVVVTDAGPREVSAGDVVHLRPRSAGGLPDSHG